MILESLMENDKKEVFLVTTSNHTLQGIFEDKTLATTFASYFKDAIVEPEVCYTKLPRFYKYECHLDLATGAVIENNECTPSFDPILLQLNKATILAVGETAQEAEENAREFLKKLRP